MIDPIEPWASLTRSARGWWRRAWRLRTLMVLVLVVGVGLGGLASCVRWAAARREAAVVIGAAGGTVTYRDAFYQQAGFWTDLYRRTGWELAREVAEVDLSAGTPQPPPAPNEPEPPPLPSRDALFRAIGHLGRVDTIRLSGLVLAPGERAALASARVRSLELALPGTEVPPEALVGLAEIGSLRALNVFVVRWVAPERRPALPRPVLARVGLLTQLQSLMIDGFAGPIGIDPATWSRLDDLQSLTLRPSPSDGAFLESLGAGHRLDTLSLPTTRATDDQLRRLAERQPNLLYLALNGSLLSDAGVEALARLPRLQGLRLLGRPGAEPGITDASLTILGRLGPLRGLNLTCGRFTARGLDALKGLPQLADLELGEFATMDDAALTRFLAGRSCTLLGFRGRGINDATLPTILANVRRFNSLSSTLR